MAANSINQHSWASIMARYAPDQKTLLAEINALEEVKDIMADAPVREADFIDMDMVTRRISLPAPYWHKVGEGITATVGHVQQATETMGMLRNQMRINEEVLNKQANREGFMAQEEGPYIEGMEQELENTVVYGSTGTAPEEFDGLDIRYPSLVADSVYDNGGSAGGSLTSMWLIQWHPTDCCLIFPKGGAGGIRRKPGGRVYLSTDTDATGSVEATKAYAWFVIADFEWDGGLCLRDPRRIKRIANIHKTIANANQINPNKMIEAKNAFTTTGQIYAYCHRDVKTQLEIQASEKGNVWWPPSTPFGKPVAYLLDMPIRRSDAILLTEQALTA